MTGPNNINRATLLWPVLASSGCRMGQVVSRAPKRPDSAFGAAVLRPDLDEPRPSFITTNAGQRRSLGPPTDFSGS